MTTTGGRVDANRPDGGPVPTNDDRPAGEGKKEQNTPSEEKEKNSIPAYCTR